MTPELFANDCKRLQALNIIDLVSLYLVDYIKDLRLAISYQ